MSKTRARSRKSTAIVSIILALVIALSATFAWLTSTTSRVNHFENNGYMVDDGSVVVNETFTPDEDWEIGETVTKQVSVTNAGSVPVLARVSFEEILNILANNGEVSYVASDATPGTGLIPAVIDDSVYSAWTALNPSTTISAYVLPANLTIKKAPTGDTLVAYVTNAGVSQSVKVGEHEVSGSNIDIKAKLALAYWTEGSNVYDSWTNTNLNATAPWSTLFSSDSHAIPTNGAATATSQLSSLIGYNYNAAGVDNSTATANKWYYNADDGFFYYLGIIAPGASSAQLLDSVTLSAAAGKAFAQVDYNISVTVQSIEAVEEAISSNEGGGWNLSDPIKSILEGLF
jgi:hypothetical protein